MKEIRGVFLGRGMDVWNDMVNLEIVLNFVGFKYSGYGGCVEEGLEMCMRFNFEVRRRILGVW